MLKSKMLQNSCCKDFENSCNIHFSNVAKKPMHTPFRFLSIFFNKIREGPYSSFMAIFFQTHRPLDDFGKEWPQKALGGYAGAAFYGYFFYKTKILLKKT